MSNADAPDLLSRDELGQLTDFLYRRTGMRFEKKKRYYLERRVLERMGATASQDFSAYYGLVRIDHAEAQELINSCTVNETYFYREEHQLRCLSRSMLPELVRDRRPGELVRIWSMPCSTGEEAYSIALWLLENWAMVDVYHIEIVGSDIDTRAIRAAMVGRYGTRALSKLPRQVAGAYFEPEENGTREIIDDLKESVKFTLCNLADQASVAAMGKFDVIFCRNLLIYFDQDSRKLAARHLHDALNPGGYLCLGHTESMNRISDQFELRRFPDAITYRRM